MQTEGGKGWWRAKRAGKASGAGPASPCESHLPRNEEEEAKT